MDASYILFVFLRRTPMIILLLGGIVFALVRWNRHPRVSFLTILGLGFYLLETSLFTFLIYFMPDVLRGAAPSSMSEAIYTVLYVLDDIAYAAVLLALVAAAFTRRSGPPSENLANYTAKAA